MPAPKAKAQPAKTKAAPEDDDVPVPAASKAVGAPAPNLAALLGAGKAHEDEARTEAGRDKSYVQIVGDPLSPFVTDNDPLRIEGAEFGSFVIPNKKVNLGKTPELVVVGLFKVYEERIPAPEGSEETAKLVGIWMPEDAEQLPVEGQLQRPFVSPSDNKVHLLLPSHWMCLWHRKHPDTTDMVITYKSVGNAVYQELVKKIKQSGVGFVPQLRLKFKTQTREAVKWKKKYMYPDFDIICDAQGKPKLNFEIKQIKGVDTPVPVEGGLKADELEKVLTLYGQLAAEYTGYKMVARKRNIAALIGSGEGGARPGIEVEEDDPNAEVPKF
jgi:hypothetical protein